MIIKSYDIITILCHELFIVVDKYLSCHTCIEILNNIINIARVLKPDKLYIMFRLI